METCNHCHYAYNPENTIFCKNCQQLIGSAEDALRKLEKRQSNLQFEMEQQMHHIHFGIEKVRKYLAENPEVQKAAEPEEEVVQEETSIVEPPIAAQRSIPSPVAQKEPEEVPEAAKQEEVAVEAPEAYFQWPQWKPLNDAVELVARYYTQYKEEGKLPIFFMTIAGIVALLAGIGYLMQYTLDRLGTYEEVVKIGAGYLSAIFFIIVGIRLHRQEHLREYASSLISLGIVINFAMIYFMTDLGEFPALSSAGLGFVLIILNTLFGIALALRYQARIIALLFLLGGALAPFYLNTTSDGSFYYFYLWLIALAACFVSVKIEWKPLLVITFLLSSVLLEVVVFANAPDALHFIIYYHIFAYLFFYFLLTDNFRKIKEKLVATDSFLLVINSALLIFNLYQVNMPDQLLVGLLFIANAAMVGIVLWQIWLKIAQGLKFAFVTLAAAFLALAIPLLVNQLLMGLLWSVEALLLIAMGFSFRLLLVRRLGYLILLAGVYSLLQVSTLIIDEWQLTLWHDGLLNFTLLGGVIIALTGILKKYKDRLELFENDFFKFCRELIPVWLMLLYYVVVFFYLPEWGYNLAIIPLLGLLWWSKKFTTHATDVFGYAQLILLAIGFAISVSETDSLLLLDQSLPAQIAIYEMILVFWLLHKYQVMIGAESKDAAFIGWLLRSTFFALLPVLFLNFMLKLVPDYFSIALWISFLGVYFLYRQLKLKVFTVELYLILVLAFFFSLFQENHLGLLAGSLALIVFLWQERAWKVIPANPHLFISRIAAYLVFFLLIVFASVQWGLDEPIATSIFALLCLVYVVYKDKIVIAQKGIYLGMSLAFIALYVSFIDITKIIPILNAGALALLVLLLHNRKGWFKSTTSDAWLFFHLIFQITLVIHYLEAITVFGAEVMGPWSSILLILHAIVLLFIVLFYPNRWYNYTAITLFAAGLLKVLIYDARDLVTVQKVILLIVIGILFLLSAYLYLRLKKRFEVKREA